MFKIACFDPAMLIAKRYFEMKNIFAMTLKTEMTRLNDSGVHRANSYFVNFLAFEP